MTDSRLPQLQLLSCFFKYFTATVLRIVVFFALALCYSTFVLLCSAFISCFTHNSVAVHVFSQHMNYHAEGSIKTHLNKLLSAVTSEQ